MGTSHKVSNRKSGEEVDLKKLASDLSELNSEKKNKSKEIYLFISFDLMDSTKLKTTNLKAKSKNITWVEIIMSFYHTVEFCLKKQLENFTVWKYIGDEILFYREITSYNNINSFLEKLYCIQKMISDRLTKEFDNPILVKATTWIADTEYYSDNMPKNFSNIKFDSQLSDAPFDFLGQDIDIGFRIAKYSYPNAVTVSAKLAYFLISEQLPVAGEMVHSDCLRILSFQELKGVWNNKPYPIIWYSPDWNKLSDDMPYEDYITKCELSNLRINKYMPIKYLYKIYEQRKETKGMNKFVDFCISEINIKTTEKIEILQKTTDI